MSWRQLAQYGRDIVEARPVASCGSGFSKNAGYPLAHQLARNIAKELGSISSEHRSDLAAVAQIARNKNWSQAKLAEGAFGKASPASKRAPWYTFDEHCERYVKNHANESISIPHIVLARLAREGFISEVLTTNYDSYIEFAYWAA